MILKNLPTPKIIDELDFETINESIKSSFLAQMPDYKNLENESDPITKLIEVVAFRELNLRSEINQKAKTSFIAHAVGTDLDNLVAAFNISRQIITPADLTTTPITPAVYESDERLRERALLVWDSITTAGSESSYIYHCLKADANIKDVKVLSPSPSVINIFILKNEGDGTANSELIEKVKNSINAKDVRPIGDNVSVLSAEIINYTITATIEVESNLDAEVVRKSAEDAVKKYISIQKIGRITPLSGIYDALHQVGVIKATLVSPTVDVAVSENQAAYCSSVGVSIA